MKYIYQFLAVVLCLFVLQAVNMSVSTADTLVTKVANGTVFSDNSNLALFAMLGLLLVFLDRPIIKRWKDSLPLQGVNWIMMIATVIVFGYIFVQWDDKFAALWVDGTSLGDRSGQEKMLDFVIAGVGIGLILDGTRRAIGWTLPILRAKHAGLVFPSRGQYLGADRTKDVFAAGWRIWNRVGSDVQVRVLICAFRRAVGANGRDRVRHQLCEAVVSQQHRWPGQNRGTQQRDDGFAVGKCRGQYRCHWNVYDSVDEVVRV